MNARELIAALGTSPQQLGEWIKAGLPHRRRGRGREFDAATVREWLLAAGLADIPQLFATMAEAAEALGINKSTLATWISQGAPGRTDNGFDVQAIRAWRDERRKPDELLTGTPSKWQERYRRERAKLARLDRLRRQGELVDRSSAQTCWAILARRLGQLGMALQKEFGPRPAKMLNDAIADCQREVQAALPDKSETPTSDSKGR